MRRIRTILPLTLIAALTAGIFILMAGCGEEKEAAKLVSTNPPDGGELFANAELVMTFDKDVKEVTVNGTPAKVEGAIAKWIPQEAGITEGQQTLKIEWTDVDDQTGSAEITLTAKPPDTTSPEAVEVSVKDGATDVDPDKLNTDGITVKFSEAIDTKKSADCVKLTLEDGTVLAWALEWSEDKTTATLTPTPGAEATFETKYILVISGYYDPAGNEGAEKTITFTTKAKE